MIELGDPVALTAIVRRADGTPDDAGAMALTVTQPDGTTLSSGTGAIIINHIATGTYAADVVATQPGRHVVVWSATGANAGALLDAYVVLDVADLGIVSLDDARAWLRRNALTVSIDEDELLRDVIVRATALVTSYLNRPMVTTTVTDTLNPDGDTVALLRRCPVQQITSITAAGIAIDPTTVTLNAHSGILSRMAGFASPLVVQYVAGPRDPDEGLVMLVLRLIEFLWQSGQQAPHEAFDGTIGAGTGPVYAVPYVILQGLDRYAKGSVA